MQNSLLVRKRFNAAQRRDLVAAYQSSGLTQSAYARQAGIGLSSLNRWLHQARAAAPAAPAGFRELPRVGSSSPLAAAAYKLQFPNGVSLEVARGFVVEELTRLCGLVHRL